MQRPMQLGGCDDCDVQLGTQLVSQLETHETLAVAVQPPAHIVVSRAAHTFSPATSSHLGVHSSVGTTTHDAAAAASRYIPPHASRSARACVTAPKVTSNPATPNEKTLFFVFMRGDPAPIVPARPG